MRNYVLLASLLVAYGNASCSDGDPEEAEIGQSGLTRSLLLSELNADQKLALCQWQEELFASGSCPASTAQGDRRPTIPAAECVAKDHNYVAYNLGTYEDCVTAISQDMCAAEHPDECKPLLDFMEANYPPTNCHGGVMCFP